MALIFRGRLVDVSTRLDERHNGIIPSALFSFKSYRYTSGPCIYDLEWHEGEVIGPIPRLGRREWPVMPSRVAKYKKIQRKLASAHPYIRDEGYVNFFHCLIVARPQNCLILGHRNKNFEIYVPFVGTYDIRLSEAFIVAP